MLEQAHRMQSLLANGFGPTDLGRHLDQGWRLKRTLASTVSNPRIDHWYETAVAAGALGGKLCGAGGGGFLLFAVPPDRRDAVRRALNELREIPLGYEPQGSRLLIPNTE
jgi:D-glycero-alpha-D-manno-heptose-7-phosphate kinase